MANGSRQPLKHIKVELFDYSQDKVNFERKLATTYTDLNGNYSFAFNNADDWYDDELGSGYDIFIKFYPESYTFKIAPDWALLYYYMISSLINNIETGSTTTFNLYVKYDAGNNVNNSFYASQAMVEAQRFAVDYCGMKTMRTLNVVFPFAEGTNFTWNGLSGISPSDCYNWDTIMHEYGHFVQENMGTYPHAVIDFVYGPNHISGNDQIYEKANKRYAMNLAYSEAWATAFAFVAQDYYKSEYTGIPYVGDNYYNGAGVNYERFSPTSYSGEGQENAIIAFLWDLFDSSPTEAHDSISLGHKGFWKATTQPGTYTLTDLMNVLESQYPWYRSQVGSILGNCQIAPSEFKVTNKPNQLVQPGFSWKVNGSIYNPNNRFSLVFYDNDDNFKYQITNIQSTLAYNNTYYYNLTTQQWNMLLAQYNGATVINACVKAYLTSDPISGPYHSKYARVDVAIPLERIEVKATDRYIEKQVSIKAGDYVDYILTFETMGNRIVQTFGTKDTYLEIYNNSSGIRNDYDDDDGYERNALISYPFTTGIEYRLRVKYYNSQESGITKLSILPTKSISNYESIVTHDHKTNIITDSLNLGQANIFTFISSTSYKWYVNLHTGSSLDTCLYLIDPRSTDTYTTNINSSCVFNDDGGGNLQAKIAKEVDSNVPYLVIVCTYHISTSSGSYYFVF